MADEIRNSADSFEIPDKSLADAESLLEEKKEEPKVEPVKVEEPVPPKAEPEPEPVVEEEVEELDHSEKSRLGRKLARQNRELAELKAMLRKQEEDRKAPQTIVDDDPEPELSEIPTAEEVRAHNLWSAKTVQREYARKAEADRQVKEQYGKQYDQMILDSVDKEEEPDLFALLTSHTDLTFNKRYSDNPIQDFKVNFTNAIRHLESKAPPKRTVHTKVPMGANTGTTKTPSAPPQVDVGSWSKEEQDAARIFSPEELGQLRQLGRI